MIDTAAMSHADYTLEASLECVVGGWSLSGPIAVHGCDRLDVVTP